MKAVAMEAMKRDFRAGGFLVVTWSLRSSFMRGTRAVQENEQGPVGTLRVAYFAAWERAQATGVYLRPTSADLKPTSRQTETCTSSRHPMRVVPAKT